MTVTLGRPAPVRHPGVMRRFFRTPKGLLLLILALLAVLSAPATGPSHVLPMVAGAVAVSALLDLAMVRIAQKRWFFPDGAILTGLIVALVLSPGESTLVAMATAALAIASKHFFRSGTANIFNPAALALVAGAILFGSGHSWWGALSDLPAPALIVLFASGLFLVQRLNKLPMALVFFGAYYLLFSATSFAADPARVAEVFRVPDVNAALFFAFFMLDDPPTCPVRYRDQVVYALIVAAASFLVFMRLGVVYYLPAGLLAGNAWEAWRRLGTRREAVPA